MNKNDLRKQAKEVRARLDISAISDAICSHVAQMPEFICAKNVLLFYPKNSEIDVLSLCRTGKNFYLPRVEGEKLLVCPYDCSVALEKSVFNVLEPCSVPVSPDVIDFAIIPCLMADRKKFRLGYGGGFYDRFLPFLRSDCETVAVCADELLTDELPTDNFDKPVDLVVTQGGKF